MQVLYVEDDVLGQRVMQEMFATLGVPLDVVCSVADALPKIDKTTYDFIMTDLRMPGLDGLSLISEIRRRADRKARTPMMVITADRRPQVEDECLTFGADDMLGKPVSMGKLVEAVGRAIAASGSCTIA